MGKGMHRRDVLAGAVAAGGLATFGPQIALAQGAASASRSAADTAFRAQLDGFTSEFLQLSPETATQLGLDHGALAGLRAQLGDASSAGVTQGNSLIAAISARLAKIDRAALSPNAQLQFDTVRYATDRGLDGVGFAYGGGAMAGFTGGTSPYVVTQQNGAVNAIPEFLNSAHDITSRADAESYLARIAAFARVLQQESAVITEQAAIGVVPPRFIADNAMGILKDFRATPAAQQQLVTNLAAKTAALGLTGYGAKAASLLETHVYPALDGEIAAFAAATAHAPLTAGVRRLPDGDAYYAWALRLGTTTPRNAEEIHRTGLEQNEEIKARIDTLLKAQGLTQGTVGERLGALTHDPHLLYSDNDQGRAQLLGYLGERLARLRALVPKVSRLALKADVTVKRVPPAIQDGAPLGYMQPAALDGSRPAIYYINLKSTTLWPRYQLATLTAHEGIPGHTLQLAYLAEHRDRVPSISSLMGFNAFVEGWALYAEQLADEGGLYADDPWGRLGYLQAQQFRACRLVVDTGLHALGWSREQAVAFLVRESGRGANAMTSEVDRYCASPGQACGYKIGHNEIVRLRDKAHAALGPRFDLAAYDDAVITTGGVPLELLEGVIDRFIAEQAQ